jgi:hypothetical protein
MDALIVIGMFGVVGVSMVVGWLFSTERRLKGELRAAPVWPIGELPENTRGRVVGQAQPLDGVIHSPLTGRACVCYVVEVTDTSKGSKTLIRESDGVPFLLVDPSGRAIIDPRIAGVALTIDINTTSGTFNDATREEEAFLAKHGRTSKSWLFNKDLEYTEGVIEVGETVAVLGSGVREPDPQAMPTEGYRGQPVTRLRLTGSRRHPLTISDDPSTTQR